MTQRDDIEGEAAEGILGGGSGEGYQPSADEIANRDADDWQPVVEPTAGADAWMSYGPKTKQVTINIGPKLIKDAKLKIGERVRVEYSKSRGDVRLARSTTGGPTLRKAGGKGRAQVTFPFEGGDGHKPIPCVAATQGEAVQVAAPPWFRSRFDGTA